MASASSRRTLDTDNITLRKIFARLASNNSYPFAGTVLVSGGDGTSFWGEPSTLGMAPSFQEFQTDLGTFYPSTSSTIRLLQSTNVYMSTIGKNNILLTTPLFSQIDISGSGSLYAYSNFLLNNRLLIAGQGFVSSVTTSSNNTLFLSSTRTPAPFSTNLISYQQLKIQSTVTSPIDLTQMTGNSLFVKNDFYMMPSLIGQRDFLLRPTVQPLQIQFELSSFSAKGYLTISTLVNTNFLSTLSTISSIYTDKASFSTAYNELSTMEGFLTSTTRSSILGVSNYTQVTYDNKTGDTLARATIIQLNDVFGLMNVGLSTVSSAKTPVYIMVSTNKGIEDNFSTATTTSISSYTNFFAGSLFNFTVNTIFGVSTYFSTLSTQMNSNYEGFSNANVSTALGFIESMKSTTVGLGTINFISSPSLVSSLSFANTFGQYISTVSQTSTSLGLATVNFISQSQYLSAFSINYTLNPNATRVFSIFASTTRGTQDYAPYISTPSFQSSLVSTTTGIPVLGLNFYTNTALLQSAVPSTTKGIFDHAAGQFPYISSLSLTSTLISTNQNLGSIGFISSLSLTSTLQSTIDGVIFWTGAKLASTIAGPTVYIKNENLFSTTRFFEGWRGVFRSTFPYTGEPLNVSTILTLFENGTQGSTGPNYDFSFTTFKGKFNDLHPYIRDSSKIVFEYNACFIFTSIVNSPTNYDSNQSFKTQLRYNNGNTVVPGAEFAESIFWIGNTTFASPGSPCNILYRNYTFCVDGAFFRTTYDQEFSFYHTGYAGSSNSGSFGGGGGGRGGPGPGPGGGGGGGGPSGTQQSNNGFMFGILAYTNKTSAQNSFFVSIYN